MNPAFFGQTNNYITTSEKYGNQYVFFNGVDFSANARLSRLHSPGRLQLRPDHL